MTESHPKGVGILFFTEMWERFSYYGMRALLFLYLVKNLNFSDELAGSIYGAYTGFVYFTPSIGGYLADQFLGYRKSILLGGFLMMCGHISLAIENNYFFMLGLFLLVIGNGFFKPNISTLLGLLYKDKPHMKDSGFTIFYMGINIGGMLGPLICGYIGETYSWHLGFGLAGLGMFFGLIVFIFGSKYLDFQEKEKKSTPATLDFSPIETDRIWAIVYLSLFSLLFWFAFEQAGSSINLFADRHTERNIAIKLPEFFSTYASEIKFMIPASVFQSLNGFLILLFAPLFSLIWATFHKRKIKIYTGLQFFTAFLFLMIGFYILVVGSKNILIEKSSMYFVILAYIFHTLGELCISPVGLSTVSKLAPLRVASLLMGLWFLSNAISHYLSGYISGHMSKFSSLSVFFSIFVYTSLFACVLLLFTFKKIQRLMHI